jgi:hypothetical protein
VYVGDLDTATRARLPGVSSNAVYSRLGYLFFVREQTIVAQRFDASSGRIIGEAIPLAQGVDYFQVKTRGCFRRPCMTVNRTSSPTHRAGSTRLYA